MRTVTTFLGSGLVLVSALALLGWFQTGNFNKDVLKTMQASKLVKQEIAELERELAKLETELEKHQKKSGNQSEDTSNLHRLRGEAARLMQTVPELDRIKDELSRLERANQSLKRNRETLGSNPPPTSGAVDGEGNQFPKLFLRDEWTFRGTETPEDTLVSLFSFALEGNYEKMVELWTPKMKKERLYGKDLDKISEYSMMQRSANLMVSAQQLTGFQVIQSKQLSKNTIQMDLSMQRKEKALDRSDPMQIGNTSDSSAEDPIPVRMRRIDGNWHIYIKPQYGSIP